MAPVASYKCELTELLESHMKLLNELSHLKLTYLEYITFVRDYEKLGAWYSKDYKHLSRCSGRELAKDMAKKDKKGKHYDIPDSWCCDCAKLTKSIRAIKEAVKKSNPCLTDDEYSNICWDLLSDCGNESGLEQK